MLVGSVFARENALYNGIALLELARMGEGFVLLDDYTVHNDIRQGRLVRVLEDHRITNTSFDQGMYATITDTPIIPAKIRLFLDFVADHVAGPERRFSAHGKATGWTTAPATE